MTEFQESFLTGKNSEMANGNHEVIDVLGKLKEFESKIQELKDENHDIKNIITPNNKDFKPRGVYQILSDLNMANKTIENLIIELHDKENALLELKEIKRSEDEDKVKELESRLENSEKLINALRIKLEVLNEQNAKLQMDAINNNEIISELKLNLDEIERINQQYESMLGENEKKEVEKIELCEKVITLTSQCKQYEEKINHMSVQIAKLIEEKEDLNNKLNEKTQEILNLQNENIDLKKENLETKQPLTKMNSFIEVEEANLSFKNHKISENSILADNLKENMDNFYDKNFKNLELLKRENERLTFTIANMKEEHKLEVFKLNATIEEFMKVNDLETSSNVVEKNSKVASIVKNIQSKVNEVTIEELKKEKAGFIETINKLKMQIEVMENTNNMDYSTLQCETNNNNNITPEKHNLENLNEIPHNEIERNNEIRERERKIEYLLQVLEEKNNLIDRLRDNAGNSVNQSQEIKDQIEFLQFTNENLLKEIEEKNAKIKKLNKDYNEQTVNYEILNNDFMELQEKYKDINIYLEEIELLKNKNKEYEEKIEKMNKELNKKSTSLIKKETEVSTLKADRINCLNNKSLMDHRSILDNRSLLDNTNNGSFLNNSLRDPKMEFLNASLNEIKDLKDKLKRDALNRSTRSKRSNESNNSIDNDKNINLNHNTNRALFEEANNDKKRNLINNSLNSMNNSLQMNNSIAANETGFQLGNISKIQLNDDNYDSLKKEEDYNSNLDNITAEVNQPKPNVAIVNRQALFVETSNNEMEKKEEESKSFKENDQTEKIIDKFVNLNSQTQEKKIIFDSTSNINIPNNFTENPPLKNSNQNVNSEFNINHITSQQGQINQMQYNKIPSGQIIQNNSSTLYNSVYNVNPYQSYNICTTNNVQNYTIQNQPIFISTTSQNFVLDTTTNTNQSNITPHQYVISTTQNTQNLPSTNLISTTTNSSQNGISSGTGKSNSNLIHVSSSNINPTPKASGTPNKPSNSQGLRVTRRIVDNINPDDLVKNQESWDFIRESIGEALNKDKCSFYFRKIFKAKIDGFSSESFYKKAGEKSPTITIVKTNHDKIIGGFTNIPWKKPASNIDFIEDPSQSSFLFSLSNKEKYTIKESSIAVCHSVSSGPVFGLNDLEIVENCNEKQNYFSNIGTSYNYYGEVQEFYGDENYIVEDYEVYQLITLE